MISISPFSKRALLIQWQDTMSKETLSEISSLNELLLTSDIPEITETIPAFTSITVCFEGENYQEIKTILEKLYGQIRTTDRNPKKQIWKLPMLPNPQLSNEILKNFSNKNEAFYNTFSEVKFTLGMKGFLPGFIYLYGLPSKMNIPRKKNPDPNIAKGSVAIGGSQCGIYPKSSPGGWHVIGNCPIPLIDLNDSNLSCFNIGDEIQFTAIDKAKHIQYQTTEWNLKMITSHFRIDE